MNKLFPWIILFAMIIAFIFSAYTLIAYLGIAAILGVINWYSDIRNKTVCLSEMSMRYILAKLFFWNRIVSKRISFYFDVSNLDEETLILGGIKFGKDFISMQYKSDEDDYFSVNSVSEVKGILHAGADYHLPKSVKAISLHFSYQYVNAVGGGKWFIVYWAMADHGDKIIHGKIQTDKKHWSIILPDRTESELNIEVHA